MRRHEHHRGPLIAHSLLIHPHHPQPPSPPPFSHDHPVPPLHTHRSSPRPLPYLLTLRQGVRRREYERRLVERAAKLEQESFVALRREYGVEMSEVRCSNCIEAAKGGLEGSMQ